MNMKKTDTVVSIIWLVCGSILVALSCLETLDEFWSGMGVALLVIGGLRMLRAFRLNKSESYREKKEVEYTDERLRYIRMKAWSWAGYLFVIIGGVATVIFKLLGREAEVMAASGAVCLIIALFWISFMVLRKKY